MRQDQSRSRTQAKESQKKHDTEIHTLKVDNAVNAALLGSGALNVKAAKALLNLDKAELAERRHG